MKLCGASNVGKIRKENQDCYKAGCAADGSFWMVLCDGMGGVKSGGIASRSVVDSLEKRFSESIPALIDDEEIKDFLFTAISKCNQDLYKKSIVDKQITMGTTIEAAVIRDNNVQCLHCGDSRIYHISKKHMIQLTKDHSMVQELVDRGKITPEEARTHPNKNIITHALGIEQNTKLDYNNLRMAKGDCLLMCSDGLSNLVLDQEIADIIAKTDFYSAPEALINMALERGGTDNITAVIAKAD